MEPNTASIMLGGTATDVDEVDYVVSCWMCLTIAAVTVALRYFEGRYRKEAKFFPRTLCAYSTQGYAEYWFVLGLTVFQAYRAGWCVRRPGWVRALECAATTGVILTRRVHEELDEEEEEREVTPAFAESTRPAPTGEAAPEPRPWRAELDVHRMRRRLSARLGRHELPAHMFFACTAIGTVVYSLLAHEMTVDPGSFVSVAGLLWIAGGSVFLVEYLEYSSTQTSKTLLATVQWAFFAAWLILTTKSWLCPT